MFPFSAIAASVGRLKKNKIKRVNKTTHPIHLISKEQYYQWINEGKCGCCGSDSGEYRGICDPCRFS